MTLYTSDSKPQRSLQVRKTIFVYLAISAFCVIFDRVYAIFGHGVSSAAMYLMFLYPLAGGVLPFLLIWLIIPRADKIKYYRLFYNIYNSGIAALTIGSALQGVFEIAGTSSPYLIVFTVCGWLFTITGLTGYIFNL